MVAGFAGMVAGSACLRVDWQFALTVNLINLLEVLICLIPLRGRSRRLPEFSDTRYLFKFVLYALIAGPLITGAIYAFLAWRLWQGNFGREFVFWSASISLGTAVVVPSCVAIFQKGRIKITSWQGGLLLPMGVILATIGAYSSSRFPLVFLLYPLLLLVVVFRGLAWASASMLYIAFWGGWMTQHGYGPFAQYALAENTDPNLVHQLFVASGIVMLYIVSALLEHRRIAEERLQKIASIHSLVTENSRDVIVLASLDGKRSFVSAACERLSGWTPAEMIQQGSFGVIHPEDMPKVTEVMVKLREGDGDYGNFECRIQKKDGEYLWVESSLRTIRNPRTGVPSGVLNMVRDISERKESEKKLQEAYRALQEMAITDALTGLCNRRRFDQVLASEWRRSARNQTPLSLLLIDVDLFKSYNDAYGHLRGDSCLKQIAQTIGSVLLRPADLACRFGGEEFAVILPATENAGALQIAQKICDAVRNRKQRHAANPKGVVTISLGCATIVPAANSTVLTLADLADKALYMAKGNGRDMACSAHPSSMSEAGANE